MKDILGQRRELDQVKAGEFFGEIPIFLGTTNIVSMQAVSRCRLARFDRQQLQELIRDTPSSCLAIFQTMTDRLSKVQQYVKDTPSSRILLLDRSMPRIAGASGVSFPPIACSTTGWTAKLSRAWRPPGFRWGTTEWS